MFRRSRLFAVFPESLETYSEFPQTLEVPLFIGVPDGEGFITGVSIETMGLHRNIAVGARITGLQMRRSEVMRAVESTGEEIKRHLYRHGVYTTVSLDISSLNLSAGSETTVLITVRSIIKRRLVTFTTEVPYRVLSMPKEEGWYAGDGHVHTAWSPDVWLTSVSDRARYAKENGLGFLIITDHRDGISDWDSPQGYVAQCKLAQKQWDIPILPGTEISAADGGHYLAYSLKETHSFIPQNRQFPGQELIRYIEANNRPYSFGAIAHPYDWLNPWRNTEVEGFWAFELLNRQRVATEKSLRFWRDILKRNLPRTFQSGEFPVALANSDCHNLQFPGEKGLTWVNIDDYDSGNPRAVWDAIRAGRVSASGSKDFACLTINRVRQGSILDVFPGETIEFAANAIPSTARRCIRIRIMDSDGDVVQIEPDNTSQYSSFKAAAPKSNSYYIGKFEFQGTRRRHTSEVWTNPIFVRVHR
jgi:hypothetical protein